jgi:HTH-type transcriptional regulator / antitoxin HigA
MKIEIINTESDYQNALARLKIIFDAKKGTKEDEELEKLVALIEKYENELFQLM